MKTFFVIMLAALLVPSLAVSQDCIDYGDYLHWVGGVELTGWDWGGSSSVAVAGNFAYVTCYSLSLPFNPSVRIANPQEFGG